MSECGLLGVGLLGEGLLGVQLQGGGLLDVGLQGKGLLGVGGGGRLHHVGLQVMDDLCGTSRCGTA